MNNKEFPIALALCKGVKCLLRDTCKRYTTGLHYSSENPHWWISHCSEDTRELYESNS